VTNYPEGRKNKATKEGCHCICFSAYCTHRHCVFEWCECMLLIMKEENDKRNAAAAAMSIQAAAAAVANDARRARLEEWKRMRSSTTEGSTGTSPGTSCASSVSSISEAVAISPRMSTSTAAAASRRQRSLTSSSASSSQSGDAKLAPPAETRASTLRKNMNASQGNLKRSTSSTSLPAKAKAVSPSSSYLRSKPRRSSSVSSGISPRQYTPSTKPKPKKPAVRVSATPTIHSSFEHHPHATSSVDDENIISTILSNSENSLQLEEEDEEDDISIYSCQSTPAIPTSSSSILGSLWSSLNRSSHHDIVLEATAVHSNCPRASRASPTMPQAYFFSLQPSSAAALSTYSDFSSNLQALSGFLHTTISKNSSQSDQLQFMAISTTANCRLFIAIKTTAMRDQNKIWPKSASQHPPPETCSVSFQDDWRKVL